MRENVLSTGLNSDQSYLINELCHSARHSLEAANRLGFQQTNTAFYAANALKRIRRSDRNNAIMYPTVSECVSFDPHFMSELASITERDLPAEWGDHSTYALGDLLSRLSAVSRTGLSNMVRLPQAELNAIRSRCINWGTPQIARAVALIGGTWDIVNPGAELLSLLSNLASQDRHLEQKIRLLTMFRASQQNISMLLGISKVELQIFTEYYLVDVYAPPGRTKHLNMKQRARVYHALRDVIDLAAHATTVLEPIDQFIAICSATEVEGRCILQDMQHIMMYEADEAVQRSIQAFMTSLNIPWK